MTPADTARQNATPAPASGGVKAREQYMACARAGGPRLRCSVCDGKGWTYVEGREVKP